MTVDADHAIRATLALLATREPAATICPSEVARSLGTDGEGGSMDGWREWMPAVHAAVDGLVAGHRIRLSWKGETLLERDGPYRIGRGP